MNQILRNSSEIKNGNWLKNLNLMNNYQEIIIICAIVSLICRKILYEIIELRQNFNFRQQDIQLKNNKKILGIESDDSKSQKNNTIKTSKEIKIQNNQNIDLLAQIQQQVLDQAKNNNFDNISNYIENNIFLSPDKSKINRQQSFHKNHNNKNFQSSQIILERSKTKHQINFFNEKDNFNNIKRIKKQKSQIFKQINQTEDLNQNCMIKQISSSLNKQFSSDYEIESNQQIKQFNQNNEANAPAINDGITNKAEKLLAENFSFGNYNRRKSIIDLNKASVITFKQAQHLKLQSQENQKQILIQDEVKPKKTEKNFIKKQQIRTILDSFEEQDYDFIDGLDGNEDNIKTKYAIIQSFKDSSQCNYNSSNQFENNRLSIQNKYVISPRFIEENQS